MGLVIYLSKGIMFGELGRSITPLPLSFVPALKTHTGAAPEDGTLRHSHSLCQKQVGVVQQVLSYEKQEIGEVSYDLQTLSWLRPTN